MPTKLSKNKLAFQREQKRLSGIVKREIKQKHITGDLYENIPKMPSVVTKKRLQAIQRMTRSDVLKGAKIFNPKWNEWEEYKVPKSRPRNIEKIKPLKTAKELHKIRSEAAKKAAQTRAYNRSEQFAEDLIRKYDISDKDLKEYAKRLIEDYQNGKFNKGALNEELEDIFDEQEYRRNDYEDEETEEPEIEEIEEPEEDEETEEHEDYTEPDKPNYSDDYDDYDIPEGAQQIIDYIRDQARYAENTHLADLIVRILDETIEREGIEDVSDRLESQGADVYALIDVVMYDSNGQELFMNTEALIDAITGNGFAYAEEIHAAMYTDIGSRSRWSTWRD